MSCYDNNNNDNGNDNGLKMMETIVSEATWNENGHVILSIIFS